MFENYVGISHHLKRVENYKYLGIYFDYNLRWNIQAEHCKENKISKFSIP